MIFEKKKPEQLKLDLRDALRCPKCKTSRPGFRTVELTNYWPSDRGTIEKVTGYRVCCQECPAIYSIDANGVTFDHHEMSLPVIPKAPVPSRAFQPELEPPDDERSRSLPPVPIPRPRP